MKSLTRSLLNTKEAFENSYDLLADIINARYKVCPVFYSSTVGSQLVSSAQILILLKDLFYIILVIFHSAGKKIEMRCSGSRLVESCQFSYTPGIYADGFRVFVFSFVHSCVLCFICLLVCTFFYHKFI